MYDWVDDELGPFGYGYRLALVHGTELARLLSTQDLEVLDHGLTFDEVQGRLFEREARTGLTDVGDGWLLVVDDLASLGDVSALGDRVLLHYRSAHGEDDLHWWVDGALRLELRPSAPLFLPGAYLDEFRADLQAAGFELSGLGRCTGGSPAAFALGERLTGVRITPELLESSVFVVA